MAFVSKADHSKICRLCTSTLGLEPYHIFADDFSNQLLRKIEDCLPIQISEDDHLPKSICNTCFEKLDDFYSFRESCRKVAKFLGGNDPVTLLKEDAEVEKSNTTNDSHEEGDGELVICEPDGDHHLNGDNVHSDDDDDDEEDFPQARTLVKINKNKKLPELGEPCSDDYVLMKEETFDIDTKDAKGGGSNILADYLVEFNNCSSQNREPEIMKDKDIFETQKLRKEVLPPMWDVYEKTICNKEDGKMVDGVIKVTHRRYIVSKGAFSCSLCGECFEFDQGRGRDELEDKARLFDCFVCGKVFPRRSSWKRHLSTHEDMKPFLCRICGYGFNRKEHLSRHLLSHTNTKPFNCEGCGKLFTRKEHLARHHLCSPACLSSDMKDTLRPFCCEVCGHGFVRKEHLLRHRKKNHDLDSPETNSAEPKPFTCDVCHKNFTRREHLRRHQIIHTRELLLNSPSLAISLIAQTKNEKQFNSEVSMIPVISQQVIASAAANLSSALQILPKDEQSGNVGDGASENQRNSVKMDEDSNDEEDADCFQPPLPQVSLKIDESPTESQSTPIMPTIQSEPSPSRPRVKAKTECDICNKNFSRRSHLLRHMKRIHHVNVPTRFRRKRDAPGPGDENGNSLTTEENTVQNCEICGKSFTKRYLLDRHKEQLHGSEIARYECVTCGQKFVESHLLDQHMAVHGNTICDNFLWM